MSEHGCTPELMMDHEGRITSNTESTASAHHRIDGVVELVKDFTGEMRVSNKNISELVLGIGLLTNEVKNIAVATEKHDKDIEDIKDNMETKDTVLKLYQRIESTDQKHEKGMDAIMAKLRIQQQAFEDHEAKPAKDALAREQAIKKWVIGLAAGLIVTIVTGYVLLYLGLR